MNKWRIVLLSSSNPKKALDSSTEDLALNLCLNWTKWHISWHQRDVNVLVKLRQFHQNLISVKFWGMTGLNNTRHVKCSLTTRVHLVPLRLQILVGVATQDQAWARSRIRKQNNLKSSGYFEEMQRKLRRRKVLERIGGSRHLRGTLVVASHSWGEGLEWPQKTENKLLLLIVLFFDVVNINQAPQSSVPLWLGNIVVIETGPCLVEYH